MSSAYSPATNSVFDCSGWPETPVLSPWKSGTSHATPGSMGDATFSEYDSAAFSNQSQSSVFTTTPVVHHGDPFTPAVFADQGTGTSVGSNHSPVHSDDENQHSPNNMRRTMLGEDSDSEDDSDVEVVVATQPSGNINYLSGFVTPTRSPISTPSAPEKKMPRIEKP